MPISAHQCIGISAHQCIGISAHQCIGFSAHQCPSVHRIQCPSVPISAPDSARCMFGTCHRHTQSVRSASQAEGTGCAQAVHSRLCTARHCMGALAARSLCAPQHEGVHCVRREHRLLKGHARNNLRAQIMRSASLHEGTGCAAVVSVCHCSAAESCCGAHLHTLAAGYVPWLIHSSVHPRTHPSIHTSFQPATKSTLQNAVFSGLMRLP